MNFDHNAQILREIYTRLGIENQFENDLTYLKISFEETSSIWLENFNHIKTVKYLMIAEAPLWGQEKKYIYNSKINNSQFFFRSDLEDVLKIHIQDKKEFISKCNEIGLLVLDISPFPLNPIDTAINYRELKKNQYRQLVQQTIPYYFEEKIKLIASKKSANIKVFYRYARVRNYFHDIISKVLFEYKLIGNMYEVGNIYQKGGGIDKVKLKVLIN